MRFVGQNNRGVFRGEGVFFHMQICKLSRPPSDLNDSTMSLQFLNLVRTPKTHKVHQQSGRRTTLDAERRSLPADGEDDLNVHHIHSKSESSAFVVERVHRSVSKVFILLSMLRVEVEHEPLSTESRAACDASPQPRSNCPSI